MWRQIFRWGTITGLFLAGSTEEACTEKWLAKIWQELYFQNARKKGVQAGFGTVDGVLGFSKTNFYFEQKKIDRKLANGPAEQLFGKSAA